LSDVSGVRYVVAAFGNIYYTDFIRKTVTCMDMNGKKIFRFQNDNMKYPCDITAIRDEFVLVTGYNSKNVIAIAADGKLKVNKNTQLLLGFFNRFFLHEIKTKTFV
jgi:outer membrane protein assembly factor BamB